MGPGWLCVSPVKVMDPFAFEILFEVIPATRSSATPRGVFLGEGLGSHNWHFRRAVLTLHE